MEATFTINDYHRDIMPTEKSYPRKREEMERTMKFLLQYNLTLIFACGIPNRNVFQLPDKKRNIIKQNYKR